MLDTNELVTAVRAHAKQHTNETGWNIIADYYTDGMIAETVGRCKTLAGALRKMDEVVALYVEMEREAS